MHLQQFDVEMQSFYFAITDEQALLCISVMCRPTLCYADIFYFFRLAQNEANRWTLP
jgi:hypothetical protein